MSGEHEIRMGPSDGNPGADGDGPNVERLAQIRQQASAFNAAADRMAAYARQKPGTANRVMDSLRSVGGQ